MIYFGKKSQIRRRRRKKSIHFLSENSIINEKGWQTEQFQEIKLKTKIKLKFGFIKREDIKKFEFSHTIIICLYLFLQKKKKKHKGKYEFKVSIVDHNVAECKRMKIDLNLHKF